MQITSEEITTALDAAVAQLLDDAGVAAPPVDAVALAKRLGFTLAWDDRQSSRARLVRLSSRREKSGLSILLKHDPRSERRQWAVAHEIGEYLSPQVFDSLGIDPRTAPPASREKIANLFASRLLLPSDWFSADGAESGWDLLELKRLYGTASHELIARRMLDFDRPIVISIIDQGRLEFRRSNVPGRVPPLTPLERQCWQRCRQSSDPSPPAPLPQGERGGGAGAPVDCSDTIVRCWPIHEPHWKREILRLELSEEW
jgi:IrrE N-terminal-like domain